MDSCGEGLAFALRCVKAGHAVRLYLAPTANSSIGVGFKGVEKVTNWLTSVKWADLILPTGNHEFMPALDRVRAGGAKVFGPSSRSSQLEIKRQAGMKLFEDHGIEVPEYKTFATLEAAEAHVKKIEERFVFKTLGDEDDKSLSYCAKTPADLIARIQHWQRIGLKLRGPCMLQKFIEGTEFAISGWLGKEGFLSPFCENFERKKLMAGDVGPNTGEMATVMKYVAASRLADTVLKPLEAPLRALGHLGDVDVNCIIDADGKAWPLEWTARCGWPSFNIQCALHRGDPAEWMLEACNGKDTLEVSPRVAMGVVVTQPDFPYSERTKAETDGIPIYGVTDQNAPYLWPQSVKRVPQPVMKDGHVEMAPTWTSAGDYLLVATGTGETVELAARRAYATVRELHVPDMIYRNEAHEKVIEVLPRLQRLGYAREFLADHSPGRLSERTFESVAEEHSPLPA